MLQCCYFAPPFALQVQYAELRASVECLEKEEQLRFEEVQQTAERLAIKEAEADQLRGKLAAGSPVLTPGDREPSAGRGGFASLLSSVGKPSDKEEKEMSPEVFPPPIYPFFFSIYFVILDLCDFYVRGIFTPALCDQMVHL